MATGRTDSLDSPSPFSGGFSPNPPSRAIVQGRGSMGVTLSVPQVSGGCGELGESVTPPHAVRMASALSSILLGRYSFQKS